MLTQNFLKIEVTIGSCQTVLNTFLLTNQPRTDVSGFF